MTTRKLARPTVNSLSQHDPQPGLRLHASDSQALDRICRCFSGICVQQSGFDGILDTINARLRNVKCFRTLESFARALEKSCGDLTAFVWLAWRGLAGLPFQRSEVTIFCGMELRSAVVDELRNSVGKWVVFPGFTKFTEDLDAERVKAAPWRGGKLVVFAMNSGLITRIGDAFLLHPFTSLFIDAVDGDVIRLVLAGLRSLDAPQVRPSVTLPPGMQPGVVSVRGKWTKLHDAAIRGSPSEILRFRNRPEFINATDPTGHTPLFAACAQGAVTAIAPLLALGADIEARDERDGMSALNIAVHFDRAAVVRALAEAGADLRSMSNSQMTPMSQAASSGRAHLITLLAMLGADVNERSVRGMTPVMHAASCGRVAALRELARLGARLDDALAPTGWTALDIARESKDAAVIRALAELGASPVRGVPSRVACAIFAAIQDNHVETLRALAGIGADLNVLSKNGETPMHYAAEKGNVEAVRVLLELGADPNRWSNLGVTPLHVAAQGIRGDLVDVLVAGGADVNARTANGWTPLMLAAANVSPGGCWLVVSRLIVNDADTTITTSQGLTALAIAREKHHMRTAALIELGSPLGPR